MRPLAPEFETKGDDRLTMTAGEIYDIVLEMGRILQKYGTFAPN